MKNFAVAVKKQNHTTFDAVMEHMQVEFGTEEFMRGFLKGYLFDQFTLYSMAGLQFTLNKDRGAIADHWIIFLYVDEDFQ